MVQRDQLPAIGADLASIAANLAEAQRFSGVEVANLNTQLESIDALIGQALAHDQDTSALEDGAITATASVLHQVECLRDDYSAKLEASLTELRSEDGYDPTPIEGFDGNGDLSPEQRGRSATQYYDANQRAKDEALVNANGPMNPEKGDAAARLRDFGTATGTAAGADSRRLAVARLDDFPMAHFVGPLPTDPVLGGDARTRAQGRLEMQRRLEQGPYGLPPMTADQATRQLDDGEQFGRAAATKRAVDGLVSHGMSPAGAADVVKNLIQYGGLTMPGLERYGESVPGGAHAAPSALSASDARALAKIAGRVGKVGDLVQFGIAVDDWAQGGSNEEFGASTGSLLGGAGGAWAAGTAAAMFTGPWTAAAVAVIGAVVGGEFGEHVGDGIGSAFDPAIAVPGGGGKTW